MNENNNNDTKTTIICPIEMLSTFVGAAQKEVQGIHERGLADPAEAASIEEKLIRSNIAVLTEMDTSESVIAATYGLYIFE